MPELHIRAMRHDDVSRAVDVALRAGLRITAHGALCVRGQPGSLRPFVPSGPFA